MQINVNQLWPSPANLYSLDVASKSFENLDSIFYIPIPRWADLYQLENQIYHLTRYSQRAFDAIVLRAHQFESDFLLSDTDEVKSLIDRISFRIEGRPIWVLRWLEGEHSLTKIIPNAYAGNENTIDSSPFDGQELDPEFVNYLVWGLRQAEMMSWTVQRGALLPKTDACHYVGPNKSHYGSFLRVGVITRSVDVLDAIAFWLLPFLYKSPSKNSLILLDSWTILSVGLNLQRYAEESGYIQAHPRGMIECLHDYDEDSDDLLRRLKCLGKAVGEFSEIILIVSVSSSNRLAVRLSDACRNGGWNIDVISLFSSNVDERTNGDGKIVHFEANEANLELSGSRQPEEYKYLCSLGSDFYRHDASTCPICLSGHTDVIRIEPSTYLLETTAATNLTAIGIKFVTESNGFFGAYAGTKCVSVHRSQHSSNRHHMIFIDVNVLMRESHFRSKVENLVASCKELFDVVLTPNHEAAICLSTFVAEISGKQLVICDQQNLGELEATKKNSLIGKRILLVDDVIISGSTLRSYRSYLRREGFTVEGFELHFLAGVARPTSEAIFAGIRDMIHPRGNFRWVEKMLLPDWHERQCPWCVEREAIELGMESIDAVINSVDLQDRYERLMDTDSGLLDNLFLFWSNAEDCEKLLSLGPNSIFKGRESKPLTQVELFVSVANAIQVMRSEGLLNEVFTTPIAKIIDPEKSLTIRYYDRVITACILRATKNHDVLAPNVDARLIAITNEMLADSSASELISEVLFAIAVGKLPSASELDRDALSNAFYEGESGVCGLLKSLVLPELS
jgi:adenine/guanine phosphoribosyltransferase-like PRPP-binding protein